MNIGINKYEKEGSLIIKDSVKAYFSDPHDNSNSTMNYLYHHDIMT
jgi:hypothetical protein